MFHLESSNTNAGGDVAAICGLAEIELARLTVVSASSCTNTTFLSHSVTAALVEAFGRVSVAIFRQGVGLVSDTADRLASSACAIALLVERALGALWNLVEFVRQADKLVSCIGEKTTLQEWIVGKVQSRQHCRTVKPPVQFSEEIIPAIGPAPCGHHF